MNPDKFALIQMILPMVAAIAGMGIAGWVATTWIRVKNGYPLETSTGKALYPDRSREADERIRLLTQENAQLRAEMGAMKDRLGTVERIVTDGSLRLDREIEQLRGPAH